MGRKTKYPNSSTIIDSFYSAVSDYYHTCSNQPSMHACVKQQDIADEFGISRLKVRKILITTGDLRYPETERIQNILSQGKKMDQIELITGMKKSTINGFLPYSKGVYKLRDVSAAAERTALYRTRKEAVIELKENVHDDWSESLWKTIIAFQNYPFKTNIKKGRRSAPPSEKFSYMYRFERHAALVGQRLLGYVHGKPMSAYMLAQLLQLFCYRQKLHKSPLKECCRRILYQIFPKGSVVSQYFAAARPRCPAQISSA